MILKLVIAFLAGVALTLAVVILITKNFKYLHEWAEFINNNFDVYSIYCKNRELEKEVVEFATRVKVLEREVEKMRPKEANE